MSAQEHPGESEDVSLSTQQVTAVHPYTAQIKVNRVPIDELRFEVAFVFTLAHVFGRVQTGRLVALGVDQSTVHIQATLMGEAVFSSRFQFNLHAELDLGDGVPLIGWVCQRRRWPFPFAVNCSSQALPPEEVFSAAGAEQADAYANDRRDPRLTGSPHRSIGGRRAPDSDKVSRYRQQASVSALQTVQSSATAARTP